MSELLSCPFCGGEAEAVHEIDGFWTVECIKCGALVDGIEAWNSRADYHGYEQAAIEAWESIKAWNSRAERTCKMETDHDELEAIAYSHEDTWAYKCSACDWSFRYDRGIKPDYCPNCGCKVVDE